MRKWSVYILECAEGSLYTGATNNLVCRIGVHTRGKGAAYTRSRLPVRLVYVRRVGSRGDALRAEWRIKRLRRAEKLKLISKKISPRSLSLGHH